MQSGTKKEECLSEALMSSRRWRRASRYLLAVGSNCIRGMRTSAVKIDGIEVMGVWKGHALILTVLGLDPPGESPEDYEQEKRRSQAE